MEENNNNERTIVDKGKELVKNKAKQKASKWIITLLPKILPVIGIFFLILLLAGLILAGQQLIMNMFNAILGVLKPEEDVVQMNKITIAAQQVHDAEMTWDYIDDDENTRLAKIKQNIDNAINQKEDDDPGTNCSTYVACVLYKAGCFPASELNKWNYISPNGVEGCLINAEWPKITKEEHLRPGDIVFFGPGVGEAVHVQIYAGGNMWYNAGTVLDIQDEAPKDKGNWKAGYDSWWAYRCPELLDLYPIPIDLVTIDENGAYKANVEEYADKIIAELERQKVNNEVAGFDTKALGNMIETYIRTEIKTSNIKTEHPDNDEDGIIVIKRAFEETGTIIDLQYVDYKTFCEVVEEGDTEKLINGKNVMQWFSINPETFDLCIAKKNNSVYTEYFGGGSSTSGGGISMEEINFEKYIENNITPLNFLIVLHLISEDVEFMRDVVDLALGKGKINPIELTYVDSRFVTVVQYDYQGEYVEIHDNCSGSEDVDINNTNVPNYYDVGFHRQTTTRYTYKLYVTNADTWLTSTSKSISEKATTTGGTNEGAWTTVKTFSGSSTHEVTKYSYYTTQTGQQVQTSHTEICNITKSGYVNEKITTSTYNTEFTIVDKEKQIKVDDFVELIKKYPKVENNFVTAPSNIFYLLQQDTSTHWHERVMRYVLFKLTDIDYGVIDGELDGLLRDDLKKLESGGGDILKAAQIVHDEEMSWSYYDDFSQLKGDIDQARANSNQVTCCSTYVSTVLYVAGYFTKEEMETPVFGNIGFNSPIWVDETLKNAGWEKITSASELQAGDVVFMQKKGDANPDHVQIYAGDNTWYNAGATMYIQAPAPYEDANWESSCEYWWAYRPPKLDTSVQGIPGELLETAQIVHDAQRTAIYTTDYQKSHNGSGGLVYGDIEKSFEKATEVTCCATYVSHVLWKAGYFTTEEMNEIGYNYQVELSKLLKNSGWEKITDEDQLQAGDIVFLDVSGDEHSCNHVQIYAGDNKWYNAGNTKDIQGEAPKVSTNWKSGYSSWWAYRPPVLGQT